MAERKIITVNEYPPIPIRQFDWRALYEGDDEVVGNHGWGSTEQAAINDLRQLHGHYCVFCQREEPVSCHRGGCPVGADL